MKGCLSLILKIVIIILAYVGFQSLGGVDFVKQKFQDLTTPSQEVLIDNAKSIADFSHVGDEYKLDRTANVLDYHMVLAEHKGSGQKMAVIDPKNPEMLTKQDFKTGEVNKKILELNKKFQYQLVRFDEFKITKKGTFKGMNQSIPYVKFEADTVNLPISHVSGIIGVAKDKEGKNVILTSVNDGDKYSQIITEAFFKKVK